MRWLLGHGAIEPESKSGWYGAGGCRLGRLDAWLASSSSEP